MSEESKRVPVTPKALYQLLITTCRYGYTRNNHLMPSGAFDHVYEYLPLMAEADMDGAVRTAIQLADEAIDQLWHYSFREDKFKSRIVLEKEGEEPKQITAQWIPGANEFSIDLPMTIDGEMSIREDSEDGGTMVSVRRGDGGKLILNRYNPMWSSIRIMEKDPERGDGWYRSMYVFDEGIEIEPGKDVFILIAKNDQLNVTDYYRFIRYCMDFAKEHGGERPYNINNFEGFLKKHPDKASGD